MRRPVAWGTKEKDGAMPTPDYLPSFMEVGDWVGPRRFFFPPVGWPSMSVY